MAEPIFARSGAVLESDLDPRKPLVYQSNSTFAEEERQYEERFAALDIPSGLLVPFKTFQGKIQVSRQRGNSRSNSFYLYSDLVKTLDGKERLCYVRYMDNALHVAECFLGRGVHYSSLFPLLSSKMKSLGLKAERETFMITEDLLPAFIEAANLVVQERHDGHYHLITSSLSEKLNISGEIYYYYKAYWSTRPEHIPASPMESTEPAEPSLYECLSELEALISKTAEYGLDCRDLSQLREADQRLQRLKKKLDGCSAVLLSRVDNLEQFQSIQDAE